MHPKANGNAHKKIIVNHKECVGARSNEKNYSHKTNERNGKYTIRIVRM